MKIINNSIPGSMCPRNKGNLNSPVSILPHCFDFCCENKAIHQDNVIYFIFFSLFMLHVSLGSIKNRGRNYTLITARISEASRQWASYTLMKTALYSHLIFFGYHCNSYIIYHLGDIAQLWNLAYYSTVTKNIMNYIFTCAKHANPSLSLCQMTTPIQDGCFCHHLKTCSLLCNGHERASLWEPHQVVWEIREAQLWGHNFPPSRKFCQLKQNQSFINQGFLSQLAKLPHKTQFKLTHITIKWCKLNIQAWTWSKPMTSAGSNPIQVWNFFRF